MVKAGLERLSPGLAMDLQEDKISLNVLSPSGLIHTPGNVWAQHDPEHPNLDFEPAEEMGKATVWICEQPPVQYTGTIVRNNEICELNGL